MIQAKQITVLIYHELSNSKNTDGYKYAFTAEDLTTHFKLISNSKMIVLTANDLISRLAYSQSSIINNTKSILISFDDGHKSNYDLAFPLLLEYGFKATFFITTDWINKMNYMSGNEIAHLSKQGMSIQSHASTHKFLDGMSRNEVFRELLTSKEKLENIIGHEVSCISIPGGRYNKTVIQCANEIGYKAIFTSVPFQFTQESDIWIIGRINLRYPLNISQFNKIIYSSPSFILMKKWELRGKSILKYFLGGDLYYQVWKLLVKK